MSAEQKPTPYEAVRDTCLTPGGNVATSYTGAPLIAAAMLAVADEIRALTEMLRARQ